MHLTARYVAGKNKFGEELAHLIWFLFEVEIVAALMTYRAW